jgi:hypothetical protein
MQRTGAASSLLFQGQLVIRIGKPYAFGYSGAQVGC